MSALPKSTGIFQGWSWSRPLFSAAFECRMPRSQHQFIELGTNVTDVSKTSFLPSGPLRKALLGVFMYFEVAFGSYLFLV